ncbi:ParA family protein [Myxococcus sp. AS-1-15]|uniref:ParA family protein n=1 Tax=Myxococcus sp. AS-1-15 TaxID=2874600 RepID=UPI001CBADA98|nr:AAA family ATPase [Myxococcus sp. AS-1-15]MBZ4401945.1 AAA family ATPase [Myxococcus sp. AS-1-15]
MSPTILSCVNLKGGVGKTAIAVNFAAYCARQKLKTLLVDLDPQTNATFSCIDIDEWESHAATNGTVADLLGVRRHATADGAERPLESIVVRDVFDDEDLHLIPSHLDLFTVDLDLASTTARETRLRRALLPIVDDYDVVVCDCPPNLTIPTQNALALSTHYVVPISPDYLSGIGVGLLLKRVKKLADELEHQIEHVGIVVSRVGRPALHREQTVTAVRQQFKGLVLDQQISERVAVSESAAEKRSIYTHSDRVSAQEFSTMSADLCKRLGLV